MIRFKDKKVVVMGLGLHGGGVGVAKFFAEQGAHVLVTDLKTKKQLKKSIDELKGLPIKFVLGEHRQKDFERADLIIKNPAVKADSPYLKKTKEVKTDIQIFFDLFEGEIIGITGTKGKSTAATLIYNLLKKKYPNTFLAGNIGISPLEILSKTNKKSKVVLELSSFELEGLKESPHIAVITTIFEDHLNRYKSFREYINSKKPIFKFQARDDVLFLNKDNKYTRAFAKEAKAKVIFFKDRKEALAVARYYKIKNTQKIIDSFKGVPHRQQYIATKRGVRYINDTAATTPQSAVLAIKKYRNIILIAGGEDKNLDYGELRKEIKKKVKRLILLPGTATDKIKRGLDYESAASMKEAVKKASGLAERGDTVLLSPASASFNLFENEFDRGNQFVKYVKEIV
jgi:UDP-N-acetylmuramoylalanine--D-glutamate ligase